jgi:hypothetical protein
MANGVTSGLLIGIVVAVGVVGGLIWLAKRGYFEPDVNDDVEQREALADSTGDQDFRIPYRRRVSAWSLPYKVFVGSLGLLAVAGGVTAYQFMRTGSPAHQYVTLEVRYAIVAVVGVAGGVRLKGWFDSQVGYLDVIYERAGQEPLVERIPYAQQDVRRREGTTTVPEIAQSRFLGLFWRYRQVGEDRRLRGADKPLEDVINQAVPDHGVERPDGSGYVVRTCDGGDQVLEGATVTADVTYASPNSLSDERAIQVREEKKRKEAELRAVQATNAELNQQIRKMRKKIENEEYKDRTELMRDLADFSDMLNSFNVSIEDETSRNGSESALENRDGQEVGQ